MANYLGNGSQINHLQPMLVCQPRGVLCIRQKSKGKWTWEIFFNPIGWLVVISEDDLFFLMERLVSDLEKQMWMCKFLQKLLEGIRNFTAENCSRLWPNFCLYSSNKAKQRWKNFRKFLIAPKVTNQTRWLFIFMRKAETNSDYSQTCQMFCGGWNKIEDQSVVNLIGIEGAECVIRS